MNKSHARISRTAAGLVLLVLVLRFIPFGRGETATWQQQHDSLVARLHALAGKEGAFGPAYQPLYHSALSWYEQWGGNPRHSVDDWMVSPEEYAAGLADALEQGRNYFAENPGALWPLCFEKQLPNGKTVKANYWLSLPTGFSEPGRTFPLIVGLHGSGWLGHKISFVRKTGKDVAAGRTFAVTPIDEGGPWQIDFLNAYLDELLRMLPVDQDRVYVEGHSLGAMATWEWALNNPERFAAISPRAGRGEPFRASRLQNVPSWVIHGANDDVVATGFADQMVTALRECGARVRYSLLSDVSHNMPEDLDENQVVDWYLQQTRSHQPPPADPRDKLGLNAAGFSPWEIVAQPEASYWASEPISATDFGAFRKAVGALFRKTHDLHEMAGPPFMEKLDRQTGKVTLWLEVPRMLRTGFRPDANAITRPAAQYVRFYLRGDTKSAQAHLAQIAAEVEGAGHHLSDELWITPLTLWPETPTAIAEYRVAVK